MNAAIASLDSKTEAFLIERNSPGEALKIFNTADSFVRSGSGGRVEIQFAVDAKILSSLPIQYQRKTSLISARPSGFAINNCLELACPTGDCGACGACDSCTGTCIPDFSVPDGEGGFEIPDTENATSDNIACQVEVDQCEEIGDGWHAYEEAGLEGCINADASCKFIEDYYAWYIYENGGFFANQNSVIYDAGNLNYVFHGSVHRDDITDYCLEDQLLIRGPEVPFSSYTASCPAGFNCPYNEESFALCKIDDSAIDFKTIFVTSSIYDSDFITEANTLYGATVASTGLEGGTRICEYHASQAGLGVGPWKAVLNGREVNYDGVNPPTVIDNESYVTRFFDNDYQLKNTQNQVVNRCNLWNPTNESLSAEILTEYGVSAPTPTQVWTGSNPGAPHHNINETIITGWIGFDDQHCGHWTGYDPDNNASSVVGDVAYTSPAVSSSPYYWFSSNRGGGGYINIPGNHLEPRSGIHRCHGLQDLRLYCAEYR